MRVQFELPFTEYQRTLSHPKRKWGNTQDIHREIFRLGMKSAEFMEMEKDKEIEKLKRDLRVANALLEIARKKTTVTV